MNHITLAPQKQLDLRLRWLLRREHPRVLQIERESFDHPWPAEELIRSLRDRRVIGRVAEDLETETVAGFFIYANCKTRIELLNLAVAPEYRRRGVGGAMLRRLAENLDSSRRTYIAAAVRESNLDAQLFFRAAGFRASRVLRDFYDDRFPAEDAYRFEWRREGDVCVGRRSRKVQQEKTEDVTSGRPPTGLS